jgi:ABC-type Fe3+/spermidine/putrescine transport system ATPase subunit
MTTPSRYRKLNQAAELYVQFMGTAMVLCQTINNMNAKLVFDDDVPQASREILQRVAENQERAFKEQLNPLIERLSNLEKKIRENLPDPNKLIVTPENNN